MTKNLITEIAIRLLGIWLFIDNFRNLFVFWLYGSNMENYYGRHGAALNLIYLKYGIGFVVAFGIAVILIKYSAPIASFIWRDRKNDDEIIIQKDGNEIVTALVAIIGLYFMVTVLAQAISELVKFPISDVQYIEKTYLRNRIISGLAYELILFIFGMFLFTKSEKIINFRKKLRKEPLIGEDELN